MSLLIWLIVVFISSILANESQLTTISNIEARYDTLNEIVNAHDGCLVKFNDTYYLYGTVYQNCTQPGPICNGDQSCGYYGNHFAVYSTKDLMEWTLLSNNTLPELLIDNNNHSYWMSNVGFNNVTKKYVMLYWSQHYGFRSNKIAIAISDTVYGPFKNIDPISVSGGNIISDTISLFIDDKNGIDAYVRYNTADEPRRHVIEKLNKNWTNSTGLFSTIWIKNVYPWFDGGGTFYRSDNDKYYTLLGDDCCFCEWGSNSFVFIADESPLNKWYLQNNTYEVPYEVNYCSNGSEPDWTLKTNKYINPCSPYNNSDDLMNFTIPSQQFSVSKLYTNNGIVFMYNGEHWKSSHNGLKAFDLQAWILLQFDHNGNILPMKWQNQWTVQLT